MQVRLKLAELLDKHNDGERGIVKRLADHTGLERHKISALLKGDVKYIGLDALARISDYLVEQYQLSPAELPSLLFGMESEQFSAHLANRQHLEFILGVRKIEEAVFSGSAKKDTRKPRRFAQRWVMASDSMLHGALRHELFGRGQQRWQAQPRSLEQRLVPAFEGPHNLDEVKLESGTIYDRFLQLTSTDRACVSVGSVKCNGLTELLVAETFDASPFKPEDDVTSAQKRSCPFFFRFRDDDLQPPSCHGGLRLARRQRATKPGIYYETPAGKWEHCPIGPRHDAALVLYVHHLRAQRLEIAMAGFTGRATRCLGTCLPKLTRRLWPPSYRRGHLEVGVFVCRFRFEAAGGEQDRPDAVWSAAPSGIKVTSLDAAVLERRLG